MKITVFGSGYVGLVTGACLAESGHTVLCVDIDQDKIDKLEQGIIPIYEPGLDDLIVKNRSSGNLKFTTDQEYAVNHGELQFIAVGTPSDEDGSADLKYVLSVAETISINMKEAKIIIDKSTVPVGTADKIRSKIKDVLSKRNENIPFEVISNPEFLKEGSAISDFDNPDRIIIGADSEWAKSQMKKCYSKFNTDKIIFMDVRSAELTKYAANAMLATKISFMNELANIAELLGADIEDVKIGIGSDIRIGNKFINPGCGYGGSCFPKDVKALINSSKEVGYDSKLIKAVDEVNEYQKETLFIKLKNAFNDNLENKVIAILGLSFKPNTDDMREAPSKNLIESLIKNKALIQAYDPVAMKEAEHIYGIHDDFILCDKIEDALSNADALVICTEWEVFKAIDLSLLKKELKSSIIVDGRNIFDPKKLKKAGLKYYAVGRADSLVMKGGIS